MRETTLSMLIAAVLPTWAGMTTTVKEPDGSKTERALTIPYKAMGQVETIRGSLMALVKEQRLIVLKGDGGMPYNFKVTSATKIQIDGKKAGFEDLDKMTNASMSVTFVPTRQGNVAREIRAGR